VKEEKEMVAANTPIESNEEYVELEYLAEKMNAACEDSDDDKKD
jgi:hypothetical protein